MYTFLKLSGIVSTVLAMFFYFASFAFAATAGPYYCGTAAENGIYGVAVWSNPSNACASDNSYATSSMFSGESSKALRLTNFGFALPDATIDGITVTIERKAPSGFSDFHVRLVSAATEVGDDKADAVAWSTTDTSDVYGGSADDWTSGLTSDDVNASDFGIDIACTRDSGAGLDTCSIDGVQIEIEYTELPPPTTWDLNDPVDYSDVAAFVGIALCVVTFFWFAFRGF